MLIITLYPLFTCQLSDHRSILLIVLFACLCTIISNMLSLRNLTAIALRSNARPLAYGFCSNNWKERDQAAEKVYITRKERDTIQRVLKKIEEEEQEHLKDNAQFEVGLKAILAKYNVKNEPFFSEVSNLHKKLN